MSDRNRKKGTDGGSLAKSLAGSAVGTVFNIVLVIVAAMLVYRFSISAFHYGVRIFGEPAMDASPGRDVEITIMDGKDFDGIADMLYDNGLIRDASLFKIQEKLSNYAEDGFKEGKCTLNTSMTPDEMMDAMAGGGEAVEDT